MDDPAGVPDELAKVLAAVLADALRVQQLALERRMVTTEQSTAALAPVHVELARHSVASEALTDRVGAVERQLLATETRLLATLDATEKRLLANLDATEKRLLDKIAESSESVMARSRRQAFEVAITVGLLQGSLIGALLVFLLR